MYIETIVIQIPKQRFQLRVEVSESTYNRVKAAAIERDMYAKDWLHMIVLEELNRMDINKKKDGY